MNNTGRGYEIHYPDINLTVSDLKKKLTEKEFGILMQHATCLACLDGNAFEYCIEQHCTDTYFNLWQNSHVGPSYELSNVLSQTAAQYYLKLKEQEGLYD